MQTVIECSADNLKAKVIEALKSFSKLSSCEIDYIKKLFLSEKLIFLLIWKVHTNKKIFFKTILTMWYVVSIATYIAIRLCVLCQCL